MASATCTNPECSENGITKDASGIPAEIETIGCGVCGEPCERSEA